MLPRPPGPPDQPALSEPGSGNFVYKVQERYGWGWVGRIKEMLFLLHVVNSAPSQVVREMVGECRRDGSWVRGEGTCVRYV